eukprot:g3106.t1
MAAAESPALAVDEPPMPEYVEVYDEPLHPTVFENDFVRVLKVDCPSNRDTMFHRHSQDSFFLFFRTAQIRNEVVGKEPFEVELQGGSFYWGDHLANPIVHKVCVGKHNLDCMDVEIKADRPKPTSLGPALRNDIPKRDLCLDNDVVRAYRVKLAHGESIQSALAGEGGEESESRELGGRFAYLAVALKSARLSRGDVKAGDNWWCGGGAEDAWDNVGEEAVEVMILQPK